MRGPQRAARVALVSGLACLSLTASARAASPLDDPYDLPEAPPPPTLPELTHPNVEAALESTVGVLVPTEKERANRVIFAQRLSVDVPFASRRWFIGANYVFATGDDGDAAAFAGGNTELYGRTMWATHTGLALGAGLGLVLPTATFGETSAVARDAATLRPWELMAYSDHTFALRPSIDVRALDGAFVVQFRQGLDAQFDSRDLGSRRLIAVSGLFVGRTIGTHVSAGIEAFEVYVLDPKAEDTRRASFIVSPSVRVMTEYLQPALSVFSSIGTPLDGNASSTWGVRLALTVEVDVYHRRIVTRGQ